VGRLVFSPLTFAFKYALSASPSKAFDGDALSAYLKAKVRGEKTKRPTPVQLKSIKSAQA